MWMQTLPSVCLVPNKTCAGIKKHTQYSSSETAQVYWAIIEAKVFLISRFDCILICVNQALCARVKMYVRV